jgi:RNA polymerase-binding transcription factor DksA
LQREMKSLEEEVEASRPAMCESCGQPIPKG